MGRRRLQPIWVDAYAAARARLLEPFVWFPFPMLVAFGLVLVLTAHILSGTNPRVGHPADVISLPSEAARDGAIWLSMTPIGDEVVVTTGDRRVFRWPLEVRDLKPLKGFRAYLKEAIAREVEATALSGKAFEHQTRVVIATDQRLKFLHVRPLLYAFAEAGISQYAFETQNPVVAAGEGGHDGHGGNGDEHESKVH